MFQCAACAYTFYFSSANATAAYIEREDGRTLFIERAHEPAKGKLAPPGGFMEVGETAEEGVRREVREEVGIELTDIRFLCSAPNSYLFREVTYPTIDIFFTARAVAWENAAESDEVTKMLWLKPSDVQPEQLAFPSMQIAWQRWLAAR